MRRLPRRAGIAADHFWVRIVSVERARDVYKVVFDGDRSVRYTVDADATARLRAEATSRSDGGP
jgi:hypothetical protein